MTRRVEIRVVFDEFGIDPEWLIQELEAKYRNGHIHSLTVERVES